MAEPHRLLPGSLSCAISFMGVGAMSCGPITHHVQEGQAGANDSCWTQSGAGGVRVQTQELDLCLLALA